MIIIKAPNEEYDREHRRVFGDRPIPNENPTLKLGKQIFSEKTYRNQIPDQPVIKYTCAMCLAKNADCAHGHLRGTQSCYDNLEINKDLL